jgi:hypothetical protein
VHDLLAAAFTVTAESDIGKAMTPNPADVGAYWTTLAKPPG